MKLTGVAPIAYYRDQFMPFNDIKISPLDRGFIFGEGMYTTLACQDRIPIFYERHEKRINQQIQDCGFPSLSINLKDIINQLLELNNLDDAAVYVHITRGIDIIRDHLPTATDSTIMIIAMPWIRPKEPGVANAMIMEDPRWAKCHLKITSLLANVQASQIAAQKGYQKVIFHRDSILNEAAQANLFLVKNGCLKTPEANQYILNGVTRQILLEEAREYGLEVQECSLTINDLFSADEVFLTASLSQIVMINQINETQMPDHYEMGNLLFNLYEKRKNKYINQEIKSKNKSYV